MSVTCRIDGAVARVALNRPDKLNALTLDTLRQLVDTARSIGAEPTVRTVILTGEGDSFCAGLDFATVMKQPARIVQAFAPNPFAGTNLFQEACWAWRRLPVPVIAAVQGHCLGGGLQLALAADFRYTTPDARWSVLEGKWGLIPDMSGIQALSHQVGMDVAKRLTMTGEMVTGERAEALGLATEALPDPLAQAEELAATIESRSPDAVAAAKRLFEATWHRGPRATFARERWEQALLLISRNTGIARAAAFTRNAPAFGPRGMLSIGRRN